MTDMRVFKTGLILSDEDKQYNIKAAALSNMLMAGIKMRAPVKFSWLDTIKSSVRDQGGCGACVSFGTLAAFEGLRQINKIAAKEEDWAEWYLFNKGRGNCTNGSQFQNIFNALRDYGTVPEACNPYLGSELCPDYSSKIVKSAGYINIGSMMAAKNYLSTTGPIVTGLEVYDTFFNYSGGVFEDDGSGSFVGNHCVCLLGYDDNLGCWIGKNSWSTQWGDGGYFKIKYGVFGMGSSFPFFGLTLPGSGPGPNPNPVATPDLTLYNGGDMWIKLALMKDTVDKTQKLKINDSDFLRVGDFTKNVPVRIGKFNKGDGLKFNLFDSAGVETTGKKQCFISGWNAWTLNVQVKNFQYPLSFRIYKA